MERQQESITAMLRFAVLPIAKVFVICSLGFLMSSKHVNILPPSGRKLLNRIKVQAEKVQLELQHLMELINHWGSAPCSTSRVPRKRSSHMAAQTTDQGVGTPFLEAAASAPSVLQSRPVIGLAAASDFLISLRCPRRGPGTQRLQPPIMNMSLPVSRGIMSRARAHMRDLLLGAWPPLP